ncbi:MAG: hypothetical protein HY000_39425 [Planctomycetes bacterium]|nr:hypothetical protein [Planctomycetota bacterium]
MGHVLVAVDREGAEVPAAFQPDFPQKVVEVVERGVGADFQMQPVVRQATALDAEMEELLFASPALLGMDLRR